MALTHQNKKHGNVFHVMVLAVVVIVHYQIDSVGNLR